ncbi:MAG: NAD(P)H-binding protein [Chloroflexota bacterium]|nr:NAD(P)H-binding protein [Chloroflexota bacterium]
MILITGATGFIGRHVVERLVADGRRVRVLLPIGVKPLPAWGETVEVISGSMTDEEALFRAVSGAHVIIHLANAQWWGRRRDLERIELEGTRALIAAARAARVGRIITLSHLGAAPSSAYPLLRVKGMVEETIRSSGLAYTILRSGIVFGAEDAFINHIAMQLTSTPFFFLMPGRGEIALHPLHIDDLVTALVCALERPGTVDQTIEIGGPEYITLEDLLFTVMRVAGIARTIVPVPPYVLRWIIGVYTRIMPRALITEQWLDILATNRTARIGNLYQYFGFQPRRLEDTLLTYMRGQPYWRRAVRYTFRRRPRV